MKYYILYNEENHGPLDIEEMEQYGLNPASRVWAPGWTEWKDAGDVPEIREYIDSQASRIQAMREQQKAEEEEERRKQEAAAAQQKAQEEARRRAEEEARCKAAQDKKKAQAAGSGKSADKTVWHLAIGNKEVGKFAKSDLLGAGMKRDSLVWKEGMKDWQEAGSITELDDLFSAHGGNQGPIADQPAPEELWHIVIKKKEYGPYRKEELLSMGLTPESPVWTEGMPDWAPAKDVARLSDLLTYSRTTSTKEISAPSNATPVKPWAMPIIALVATIAAVAVYVIKQNNGDIYCSMEAEVFVIFNAIPIVTTLISLICAGMAGSKSKQGNLRGAAMNCGVAISCGLTALIGAAISIYFGCGGFMIY